MAHPEHPLWIKCGTQYWNEIRQATSFWADLSGADLRGVVLQGGDLRGANLKGADLMEADLMEADLSVGPQRS